MSTLPAPRYQRNVGLDILRSAAIVVVLMNHGFLGFFVSTGLGQAQGWGAVLSACAVFSIEWLFVLSGFLIGSMMIRSFEARQGWLASARDFWLRRWFRTIPNYYLFLLVNAALVWWGIAEGRPDWSFALFSQNLLGAQEKPYFFSEAWSLALDEWFYLLMPLLLGMVAWLWRAGRKQLFWAVAALLILAPTLLRCLLTPPAHFFEWDDDIRRVTVMHLDATGWGVAAAIANRWHGRWWTHAVGLKALAGAALMLGAAAAMAYFMLIDWRGFAGGRFNDLALITAPSVAVVLMLPWLSQLHLRGSAVRWLSAKVGDYAYSVYLSHMPVLMLVLHLIRQQGWPLADIIGWVVPAWVALVFAVSALVFHTFEKPVSDLRERFTRRVQAGPFGARERA